MMSIPSSKKMSTHLFGFFALGILLAPYLALAAPQLVDLAQLSPDARHEIEEFLKTNPQEDDIGAAKDSAAAEMRFSLGPLTTATAGVISKIDPVLPQNPFFESFLEEKDNAVTENIPIDEETWDFIVVGCGSAGCPLAGGLAAESNAKVLVIERGMERTALNSPNAQSIEGSGIGLSDPTIAQPIVTTQGVITWSGAVMGGGSAVNLGIMVAETQEFFDKVAQQFPGFKIEYAQLQRAYQEVEETVGSYMPESQPWGPLFSAAMKGSGYESYGGGAVPAPSSSIQMGYQWQGATIFDANESFYRKASDVFLPTTPNIKVMTRTNVRRVTFDESSGSPVASCVVYRPTKYNDIKTQGITWQLLPSTAADWSPWVGSFFSPKSVLIAAGNPPMPKWRRACLRTPGQGRIILSAGTVQTAALLFRSGIGPAEQLKKLNVPVTVENQHVGAEASDRVFITVPGFLKNYPEEPFLQSLTSGLTVRRLQPGEDQKGKLLKKLKLKAKALANPSARKNAQAQAPVEILSVVEDPEEANSRFFGSFNPPVVLPDFLLYPGKMIKMEDDLQPRVCQYLGIKQTGPQCNPGAILDPSLQCSVVPIEELGGGRTAEGFIYASRFVFPPPYRMDPVVDALIEFLLACANYRSPFNVMGLKPLCTLAMPIIKCFRKAMAPFNFSAEPSSRGSVEVLKDGNILFNPNYLTSDKDLFDAIRSTSTLINQMNGDYYKGIMQPKGPFSCPVTIANGLLDILLLLGSWTSPFLTDPTNFKVIQEYLQDLVPVPNRRLRRLMVVEEGQVLEPLTYVDENGEEFEDYSHHVHDDVDEEKMQQLGIKEALAKANFDFASYKAHHSGEAREDEGEGSARRLDQSPRLKNVHDDCKRPCTHAHKPCASADVCCLHFGNPQCQQMPGQEALPNGLSREFYSDKDGAAEEPAPRPASVKGTKSEEFFNIFAPLMAKPIVDPQWAATFPPTLPSVANPKAVAKFALTYMTSIGHLYGSAPMGKVVDENFAVLGTGNLHVVDASILPQLPRMNPTFTLMALGRYAAERFLGP